MGSASEMMGSGPGATQRAPSAAGVAVGVCSIACVELPQPCSAAVQAREARHASARRGGIERVYHGGSPVSGRRRS